MIIENARPDDAEELLAIYAPYVQNTAISFEIEVPTVEDFKRRIETVESRFPYLKAVENGKIIGYAYASPFKTRKAYDYSVETSIYIKEDFRGKRIGTMLYTALEERLVALGITNMNACIAMPAGTSEYLNETSAKFHEAICFSLVGRFHSCAYKFDEWFDMIWMEKHIAKHENPPKRIIGS